MAICDICGERHYPASWDGPEEPCLCGHGLHGESVWQYAGLRGLWAQFRLRYLRRAVEWCVNPLMKWLYGPVKF